MPSVSSVSHGCTAYKQPLLYNLAVTREVLKQIYIAESLQPPSLAAVRSAYETIWTRAINPAYWRGIAQSGEIVKVGIYGVEAYTIFKVRTLHAPCSLETMHSSVSLYTQIGEILGRRSLIGYDLH